MRLIDYFAPFTIINITQFILILFLLDVTGFTIAHFLKFPRYLRHVYWLIGLSFCVLCIFYLHIFLPLSAVYLWLIVAGLGLISIVTYYKYYGIRSLFTATKEFPYTPFIVTPVLKPLYFLLSAPPYIWDELAYHYYSPSRLITESNWLFIPHSGQFGPGLYDLLPRFLDTSYIMMFSLTHTYATARLLHFLVFLTCIWCISLRLKKDLGVIGGVIFSVGAIYLTPSLLRASTWGYVDAGTAAISVLALVLAADWIKDPKRGYFFALSFIIGIGISSKYTVLPFLIMLALATGIVCLGLHFKNLNVRRTVKLGIGGICLVFFSGGYWYWKNIAFAGNPIYPFLFACKHGIECGKGAAFFSGWTTPLHMTHAPEILTILFNHHLFLAVVTFAILLCSIILAGIRISFVGILSWCISFTIFLEILVAKNVSGFELRYFYHWSILIPLILVLPFGYIRTLFPIRLKRTYIFVFFAVILCIGGSISQPVFATMQEFRSNDGVEGQIRNYAMHRMSFEEWIKYYFPEMHEVISMCGTQHEMRTIHLSDPRMIWTSKEGLMRMYMVNCKVLGQSPDSKSDLKDEASKFIATHTGEFIASTYACGEKNSEESISSDPLKFRHYLYNQEIICRSTLVQNHLYKIGK